MFTLTEQRAAVDNTRYERWAGFERNEQERRRRDEITDQAERLAAPMENTFEYKLTPNGLRSDLGEYLLPILEEGYKVAAHQAGHDSRWIFEWERRGIEVEELRDATTFARAEGVGVRITSLTLDKSNYLGMQAIAIGLGHQLPQERPSSEDILRNRLWTGVPPGMVVLSPIPDAVRLHGIDIGAYDKSREKMHVRIVTPLSLPKGEHKALIGRIRTSYDQSLAQQLGGEWFAGRRPMTLKDAKGFIEHPDQADLLAAHMEIVNEVYATTSDKQERLDRLAVPRYNFAAALDDRMHGKKVASLSDAGDAARAEGKSFDGDCPTTSTTTTQQMERLGYRAEARLEILKCVNCPYCKKVVDAKKVNTFEEKSIQCLSCDKKVDLRTGKVVDEVSKSPLKRFGKVATKAIVKVIPPVKNLLRRQTLTVGGVKIEYIDLRTNAPIQKTTS